MSLCRSVLMRYAASTPTMGDLALLHGLLVADPGFRLHTAG